MRVSRSGFTMVELIVVIVIIGILSTIGAAKFSDRHSFDSPAFSQQVKSMLRFGQKMAIAQNRPVFVTMSASRAGLCYDAACAMHVNAPAGGNSGTSVTLSACGNRAWYCEGVPNGLAISSAATLMFFDAQGRPFAGTDALNSDQSSFNGLTITINGSSSTSTVIIERETGYVH